MMKKLASNVTEKRASINSNSQDGNEKEEEPQVTNFTEAAQDTALN